MECRFSDSFAPVFLMSFFFSPRVRSPPLSLFFLSRTKKNNWPYILAGISLHDGVFFFFLSLPKSKTLFPPVSRDHIFPPVRVAHPVFSPPLSDNHWITSFSLFSLLPLLRCKKTVYLVRVIRLAGGDVFCPLSFFFFPHKKHQKKVTFLFDQFVVADTILFK